MFMLGLQTVTARELIGFDKPHYRRFKILRAAGPDVPSSLGLQEIGRSCCCWQGQNATRHGTLQLRKIKVAILVRRIAASVHLALFHAPGLIVFLEVSRGTNRVAVRVATSAEFHCYWLDDGMVQNENVKRLVKGRIEVNLERCGYAREEPQRNNVCVEHDVCLFI